MTQSTSTQPTSDAPWLHYRQYFKVKGHKSTPFYHNPLIEQRKKKFSHHLTLNIKNIKDPLQFYLVETNQHDLDATKFIAEVENQVKAYFRERNDELAETFSAKTYFPTAWHSKKDRFSLPQKLKFLKIEGIDKDQKTKLKKFFQKVGVKLPGADGTVFLEPETTSKDFYYASFIIPYRVVQRDDKEEIQFLLSTQLKDGQHQIWFMGGKRDFKDKNSVDTALRELNEETSFLLPPHVLSYFATKCAPPSKEKKQRKNKKKKKKKKKENRGCYFIDAQATHYYFVPDLILSDALLNQIVEDSREKPSKEELIQQWKEKYSNDQEAIKQALLEGSISFDFDAAKAFNWVSLREGNVIIEQHDGTEEHAPLKDRVPAIIKKGRKKRLLSIWKEALKRKTKEESKKEASKQESADAESEKMDETDNSQVALEADAEEEQTSTFVADEIDTVEETEDVKQ